MGQFESGPEKIPSKESVMEVLKVLANGRELMILREINDRSELQLLEVEASGGEMDETIHFEYRKKAKYPNGSPINPIIHIEIYENDVCSNGYNVAEFDPNTGEWHMIE